MNDSNVLILGETGTGKELFAQSIHSYSKRKDAPFMALNCAAIPETLLESLLFGTTKGAYTGSVDKAGLFEQADGGTIFLDEINSMPLMLQAKLLRILEEHTVMRLGDNKNIPIDVRIISSCNENPRLAIQENKFRSDLFFRLAVVYLNLLPLRDRREDIEVLCHHFIEIYNQKLGRNILDVSAEVKELFESYGWPGNVRQLKHVIESAMNIASPGCSCIERKHVPAYVLDLEDVGGTITRESDGVLKKHNDAAAVIQRLKDAEYEEIIRCLEESNGNIAKAAKMLGMSRQKLHYRISKYKITE